MGSKTHIKTVYGHTEGQLINDLGATLPLGLDGDKFSPYQMLLGALSYCLFLTYESLAEKMAVEHTSVEIDITGVKRDDKVSTLEHVMIDVLAKGVNDQKKFERSFEIATRYCSVFNTISQVAKIEWKIRYE
ncbi:MAG: OsmC family protein [Sphaerochaetaceae bacterium]|jgi:putative redox protein|nr:OsmC family protein [Sphaerochaetaceae bacterium]HHU88777.1 OsmC family protein [Spirochaetales bacterium]